MAGRIKFCCCRIHIYVFVFFLCFLNFLPLIMPAEKVFSTALNTPKNGADLSLLVCWFFWVFFCLWFVVAFLFCSLTMFQACYGVYLTISFIFSFSGFYLIFMLFFPFPLARLVMSDYSYSQYMETEEGFLDIMTYIIFGIQFNFTFGIFMLIPLWIVKNTVRYLESFQKRMTKDIGKIKIKRNIRTIS